MSQSHKVAAATVGILLLAACGRKTAETTPTRGNIVETVFASGTLEPRNRYNLTAQSEGYIKALKAKEGDTLAAGAVVAEIENVPNTAGAESARTLYEIAALNATPQGPMLQQALQNVELLGERRRQDSLQESRFKRLFEENSASRVQYENASLAFKASRTAHLNAAQAYIVALQQSRQQLAQQEAQLRIASTAQSYNHVVVPVGGKIYRRLKEQGDYVRRGEVIAVIGDAGDLYARLSVDENSIGRVKPGQEVIVNLNTAKQFNYKATITRILPAFDEQTQSFICEAEFIERPEPQIAGSQLQANIITGKKSGALLIPRTYLSYGNKVRLKEGGEKVLTTGFVSGDWVEVLDGLDEKTVIVTDVVK